MRRSLVSLFSAFLTGICATAVLNARDVTGKWSILRGLHNKIASVLKDWISSPTCILNQDKALNWTAVLL
jgi:hypothetical protein